MWRRSFFVLVAAAAAACSPSPVKTNEPRPVATNANVARVDGGGVIETTSNEDAGAVRPGAHCSIAIKELISADVFRGVPRSPAREDSYARLDPKTQSEWDAADHGLLYLSCVYAVEMNGTRYKFQHIAGEGFILASKDELDPKQCATSKIRDEAAKSVRSSTHECEDPHRGAYWGFDLVPLP